MNLFNLSFGFPSALWGIPLLTAGLIIIYLNKGKAKQAVVPTVFLLKKIHNIKVGKNRIRLPLRLLFEILICIILISGMAILQSKSSQYKIIVIDNSFSMNAAGLDSATLLDEAIGKAEEFISNLGLGTSYKIFATSPSLKEITKEELKNLKTSYSEDYLQINLESLFKEYGKNTLVVFSDKSIDTSLNDSKVYLSYLINRTDVGNIALSNISFNKKDKAITAVVSSFVTKKLEYNLKAQGINEDLSSGPDDEFFHKTIELLPQADNSVTFPMKNEKFVAVKISISTENTAEHNVITNDDTAWISLTGSESGKIEFVSDIESNQLGLDQLQLNISSTSPADYLKHPNSESAGYIFHRFVPSKLPSKPALFIFPENNRLFESKELNGQQILLSSWDSSHPLLKYLKLSSLLFNQVKIFNVPQWGKQFLNVEQGNIAFAGHLNGERTAVLGFEILPFQGRDSIGISVLTLNLLSWLFEQSFNAGYIATYDNIETENIDANLQYIFSSSDQKESNGKLIAAHPGLILAKNSRNPLLTAVNYFNRDESNITKSEVLYLELKDTSQENQSGNFPFYTYLAWITIILLLADALITGIPFKKGYV